MATKISRRKKNQIEWGTARKWTPAYQREDLGLSVKEILSTDLYIHSNLSTFNNTYSKVANETRNFLNLLERTVKRFELENANVIKLISADTNAVSQAWGMGNTEGLLKFIQSLFDNTNTLALSSIVEAKQAIQKKTTGLKDMTPEQIEASWVNMRAAIKKVCDLYKDILEDGKIAENPQFYRNQISLIEEEMTKLTGEEYKKSNGNIFEKMQDIVQQSFGWLSEPGTIYDILNSKSKVKVTGKVVGDAKALTDAFIFKPEDLDITSPDFNSLNRIGLNIKSNSKVYHTEREGIMPLDFWNNSKAFKLGAKITEFLYWNEIALNTWSTNEMRFSKTTRDGKSFGVEENYGRGTRDYVIEALSLVDRVYYTAWLYSTMVENKFTINTRSLEDVLSAKYEQYKSNNKNIVNYFVVMGSKVFTTENLYTQMNNYYANNLTRRVPEGNLDPVRLKNLYGDKKSALKANPPTDNSYSVLLSNGPVMNQIQNLVEPELLNFFTRKTNLVYNFTVK